MHDELVAEHGGSTGVRDAEELSEALARPRNRETYGKPSVFDLAAAYAFGIVRNRPFIDGNRRTGFLAACVFLELNGWELRATEVDAMVAMLDLAADEMDETGFSFWVKAHSAASARK